VKVYVYPADETGCGYYRLIWPARSLQASRLDIEVVVVNKKDMQHQFQGKMRGDQMIGVVVPPDADVVVLQRPTHQLLHQAVPLIRQHGIAVVIDMDDDLTCIDPRNPAWLKMHPNVDGEHSWSHARPACDKATLVTVSTAPLLDVYARKTPGVVLPNYVPQYFTEIEHEDSAVVGWGGSVMSHPDDLQVMGPAIARLSRELDFFTVVGPDKGVANALGSSVAKRVQTTGAVNFIEWPHALAKHLGIGVAPTSDTRFNRAKSWLKPLEYASVGIPPVSSDRPEYVTLVENYGIGWIASSPKDWYRLVMKLARDDDMRREFGTELRRVIAEHLTIERNIIQWVNAWRYALELERG